jgi:hypothetical protein
MNWKKDTEEHFLKTNESEEKPLDYSAYPSYPTHTQIYPSNGKVMDYDRDGLSSRRASMDYERKQNSRRVSLDIERKRMSVDAEDFLIQVNPLPRGSCDEDENGAVMEVSIEDIEERESETSGVLVAPALGMIDPYYAAVLEGTVEELNGDFLAYCTSKGSKRVSPRESTHTASSFWTELSVDDDSTLTDTRDTLRDSRHSWRAATEHSLPSQESSARSRNLKQVWPAEYRPSLGRHGADGGDGEDERIQKRTDAKANRKKYGI